MRKFKHKTTKEEVELYNNFYVCKDSACIPKRFIENSNDWEEIIEKINQPLFKTIDGVDILENQPYWGVSTKNFTIEENLEGSVKASIPYYFEDKTTDDFLTFSNRENAERYIKLNSPKYSIKDIIHVVNNWSMCRIDEDNILNFLAKSENNSI